MPAFVFQTVRRIESAPGLARRLGELVSSLDPPGRSALIVTDAFLASSGLIAPARTSLEAAGWQVAVFDAVTPDPSEAVVEAARQAALAHGAGLVIGFGGGSSMDVAKLVACLARPEAPALTELYGIDTRVVARLPLVQVPTTAGTGSEVTRIAIVTTGADTKAGVVNRALLADLVLLDAELTVGLPPAVSAATGIDAMVHAIEAFTSRLRANPLSDLLAVDALRRLDRHLLATLADGRDLAAREQMLLGAMLAGMAFENAPVAAVHALAYPLGGQFHLPHGLSNALVLVPVLRFNRPAAQARYAALAAQLLPKASAGLDEAQRCEAFIAHVAQRVADCAACGLAQRLRDCGIPRDALPGLAAAAMQQQRLLQNNPRPLTEADALAIYEEAW
ncbi:iron-containing alcohol dehydrogenase (plasmid) [Sphaerotilus natans]|uniref:iron-containing alcohol dehydrogenase n=1 Tax=Sphaerotilus natans TaxID=34103 RepID=UPI00406CA8E8